MKIVIVGDPLSVGGIDIKKRLAMSYGGHVITYNMSPVPRNRFRREVMLDGSVHPVQVETVSGFDGNIPANMVELRRLAYQDADIVIIALPLTGTGRNSYLQRPDDARKNAEITNYWWAEIKKEAPNALPFIFNLSDHINMRSGPSARGVPTHLQRHVYFDDSGDVYRALNQTILTLLELRKRKIAPQSKAALKPMQCKSIAAEQAAYEKLNDSFKAACDANDLDAVIELMRDPRLSIETRFNGNKGQTLAMRAAEINGLHPLLGRANLFCRDLQKKSPVDHAIINGDKKNIFSLIMLECRQLLARTDITSGKITSWKNHRDQKISAATSEQQQHLQEIFILFASTKIAKCLNDEATWQSVLADLVSVAPELAIVAWLHVVINILESDEQADFIQSYLKEILVNAANHLGCWREETFLAQAVTSSAPVIDLTAKQYANLDFTDAEIAMINDIMTDIDVVDAVIASGQSVVVLAKNRDNKTVLQQAPADDQMAAAQFALAQQGLRQAMAQGQTDKEVASQVSAWFDNNQDYPAHIKPVNLNALTQLPFVEYFNEKRVRHCVAKPDPQVALTEFFDAASDIDQLEPLALAWSLRDVEIKKDLKFALFGVREATVFTFAVLHAAEKNYIVTQKLLQALFADEIDDGASPATQLDHVLSKVHAEDPGLCDIFVNYEFSYREGDTALWKFAGGSIEEADMTAVYIKHGAISTRHQDGYTLSSWYLQKAIATNWTQPHYIQALATLLQAELREAMKFTGPTVPVAIPGLETIFPWLDMPELQKNAPDVAEALLTCLIDFNINALRSYLEMVAIGATSDSINIEDQFVASLKSLQEVGDMALYFATLKRAVVICAQYDRLEIVNRHLAQCALPHVLESAGYHLMVAELAFEHGINFNGDHYHSPSLPGNAFDALVTRFVWTLYNLSLCEYSLRHNTIPGEEGVAALEARRIALLKQAFAAVSQVAPAAITDGKAFVTPQSAEAIANTIGAHKKSSFHPGTLNVLLPSSCWDAASLKSVLQHIHYNQKPSVLVTLAAYRERQSRQINGWARSHYTAQTACWEDVAVMAFEQMLDSVLKRIASRAGRSEHVLEYLQVSINEWIALHEIDTDENDFQKLFINTLYPIYLDKMRVMVTKTRGAVFDTELIDVFPEDLVKLSAFEQATQAWVWQNLTPEVDADSGMLSLLKIPAKTDCLETVRQLIIKLVCESTDPVTMFWRYMGPVLRQVEKGSATSFESLCVRAGRFPLRRVDFNDMNFTDEQECKLRSILTIDVIELLGHADNTMIPAAAMAIRSYDPAAINMQVAIVKRQLDYICSDYLAEEMDRLDYHYKHNISPEMPNWLNRQTPAVQAEVYQAVFERFFTVDKVRSYLSGGDKHQLCYEVVELAFAFLPMNALRFFESLQGDASVLSAGASLFDDAVRVMAETDPDCLYETVIACYGQTGNPAATQAAKLDAALTTLAGLSERARDIFLNAQDETGQTKLHKLAQQFGQHDEIAVLLKHGADHTITDKQNRRAIALISEDASRIRSHQQLLVHDFNHFVTEQRRDNPNKPIARIYSAWKCALQFEFASKALCQRIQSVYCEQMMPSLSKAAGPSSTDDNESNATWIDNAFESLFQLGLYMDVSELFIKTFAYHAETVSFDMVSTDCQRMLAVDEPTLRNNASLTMAKMLVSGFVEAKLYSRSQWTVRSPNQSGDDIERNDERLVSLIRAHDYLESIDSTALPNPFDGVEIATLRQAIHTELLGVVSDDALITHYTRDDWPARIQRLAARFARPTAMGAGSSNLLSTRASSSTPSTQTNASTPAENNPEGSEQESKDSVLQRKICDYRKV